MVAAGTDMDANLATLVWSEALQNLIVKLNEATQ